MKLENRADGRSAPARAIAAQSSGHAARGVDHSHAHKNLLSGEVRSADPPAQQPTGRPEKPAVAVSAELAAYVARRTP
jgi:hypothetical protein